MKTLIKSTWLIVSLLMLFSSTELSGQTVVDPFLRFSGIDRWQGLTYSRSNNYVGYSFTEWQTVDSVLFDSIMFYQRGNSFHGFQASTNKYYLLENGVKKLYLDFSVPTGSTFTGVIGGGVPVVVSGSENIRYFNAHYGFWPRTEQELTYTKNLGVTKDYIYMVQSSNWGEYTTTLLSQLWLSLNGDTLYVDHGYTPYLSFNPIVSPSVTYSNHFEYSAGHTLNYFMYQYATTFNFNDSMFFEYYYSNGLDSTDFNSRSQGNSGFSSFDINFDSTMIQNGYHVKYRLKLRDRSIRPKYAYSPADQSYYTLHIDPTVGIEDEAVPDNFFQIAVYPNPFNSATTLQIDHFESGEVTVNIYSLTGEKAMEPVLIHKESGTLTLPIEFKSQPSGIYLADVNFVSSSGKMHRKHQKLVYLK